MGRIVYTPFNELSVTTDADQDIIELTASATNKLRLHYIELTSSQTTAESVELILRRRTGVGSGGSAATEVKADADDGAITGAVASLVTTPGSAGDILGGWRWEQLGPFRFAPTPMIMPIIELSTGIAVNLNSAVGATRTWGGLIVWEEI